ncbi:MAG: Acetyl-CoA hydrolase/transferase, partial [Chthonomonadales bacterium]|nr:Acetyl-CoA hydrolase/transferase [Chthonomonadales bacterium]
EIPALFRSGQLPLDVALIMVSPPDVHGYCSLGISVDVVKAAVEKADIVIAEVNRQMPRTLGDSFLHVSQIDSFVESDCPLVELLPPTQTAVTQRIGQHIADLIEDGSTLQMGIGAIPDAALACLTDKHDLGIHTEMFSDGLLPLVAAGVVTGHRKTLYPDKIVSSFCMGTRALYDFVDNNPAIEFHPSDIVNDPFIIAQNDKMVAINAAIEVDLTGQVCADSIGERFYSGIGGQVDFLRGAARSRGGKPIIALPSTAHMHDGTTVSRIVSNLKPGAGIVTSRGDVHYVVTEWGAAYLHGKSIRERTLSLIAIAHPDFRDALQAAAQERHLIHA